MPAIPNESLTLEAQSGAARRGILHTSHGAIETPVFMPVGTLGSVKGVAHETLEQLDARIILANTYHMFLRPGTKQVAALGGLHGFMAWKRALLTDSGGFQVFSLNELRKVSEEGVAFRSHLDGSPLFLSPETSMQAQIELGADIIMAFDECTEYPADESRARASMELTLRWTQRCKTYFEAHKHEVPWGKSNQQSVVSSQQNQNPDPSTPAQGAFARDDKQNQPHFQTQALFGIVQGGMYPQLRRESAERTVEMGFPGYAIGGLSVGEPRERTREVIAETLPYLPADQPRYVMGVGYPEEIVEYAAMGVDMMDCVLPTRAARHGLLFTSVGRINIKNARYIGDEGPPDPHCSCLVCRRYSRAYLRHLFASGELLGQVLNSTHNLAFYLDTMRGVRDSISSGELPGFARQFRERLQQETSQESAKQS